MTAAIAANAAAGMSPSNSFSNLFPTPSTLQGGMATISGSSPPPPGRQHRRSSSIASTGAMSVQSEASFMSVVSDIRKSSFYGGYDENTGNVQLHYPRENIHLSSSKELRQGWIYAMPIDTEAFEEYHRQAEDAMFWEDEELDHILHKCGCECPACYHGCTGHSSNSRKKKITSSTDPFLGLPQTTYALAIDENIYKRVLDEISQASTMPCGLFYCGHHEDVDHPSILIALVIVVALLVAMGCVTEFAEW